jgi:hypothetical protein
MLKKKIDTNVCCNMGSYDHQIPMPIECRVRDIDYCISDIVAALNSANITTASSCCGHNEINGTILLNDGRIIEIHNVKRKHETGSDEWQRIINKIGAKGI